MAELEKAGKCKGVVTQNIDGLHTMAGSSNVLELHGSIHRNYCEKCGKFHSLDEVMAQEGVPYCECGGMIKPDVVLYEESLDYSVMEKAVKLIETCDTLIIVGTSLVVYPAAGMVRYFRGNNLVVMNMSATSSDSAADLVIRQPAGEVLAQIKV